MRSLFALLLLALPLAAAPVPKALKKTDADRIVGRWVSETVFLGLTTYTHTKGELLVIAPTAEKSETIDSESNRYPFEYSFPGGAGEIDLACNGHPYVGRYTLDADTFRVAFHSKIRPTSVDPVAGGYLYEYRREGNK